MHTTWRVVQERLCADVVHRVVRRVVRVACAQIVCAAWRGCAHGYAQRLCAGLCAKHSAQPLCTSPNGWARCAAQPSRLYEIRISARHNVFRLCRFVLMDFLEIHPSRRIVWAFCWFFLCFLQVVDVFSLVLLAYF